MGGIPFGYAPTGIGFPAPVGKRGAPRSRSRLRHRAPGGPTRSLSACGGEATLRGGYLGALVFLTDDHRLYDAETGQFERVKPARPLTEGGVGAVEIGARLDGLDLTDAEGEAGGSGGAAIAGTAILNWYPTDILRFTASHTLTRVTDGPDEGDRVNATLLRATIVY